MSQEIKIKRRTACASLLGLGGLLVAGKVLARPRRRVVKCPALSYKNSDFYNADGTFNADAAKDVYLAMLRAAGYPLFKNARERMWAKDWNTGEFTNVGLGGFIWVNNKDANYCALEMILLPNQMIPEHWHVGDKEAGIGVKMESWHVRWGNTYTYGEGPKTEKMSVTPPKSQAGTLTALCENPLGVGDVGGITKPLEKHWQQAGPRGCIMTEPSNYHSDALMRYSNPDIKA